LAPCRHFAVPGVSRVRVFPSEICLIVRERARNVLRPDFLTIGRERLTHVSTLIPPDVTPCCRWFWPQSLISVDRSSASSASRRCSRSEALGMFWLGLVMVMALSRGFRPRAQRQRSRGRKPGGMRARGRFQLPGGVGGWKAGGWHTGQYSWQGCWNGSWHGGWKPQLSVGRVVGRLATRRWRCFEGGPKVSTVRVLDCNRRSMALARALAVQPSADGMAASSFGA
jgi:hypothetical protein